MCPLKLHNQEEVGLFSINSRGFWRRIIWMQIDTSPRLTAFFLSRGVSR